MKKLKSIFMLYHNFLEAFPKSVQSVQTGVLMGTGDVISQLYFDDKTVETLDVMRAVKFSALGLFFVGPVVGKWYKFLDTRITEGTPLSKSLKKVVLDQIFIAPAMLFVVTSGVSLLDGKTVEETKKKLNENYFHILLNNYKVWPLVQVVNFSLVPVNYQLLLVQTVAVFWNIYLSYSTHEHKNIRIWGFGEK